MEADGYNQAERKEFLQIIWSSGKILEFYVQSRLSEHQINSGEYELTVHSKTVE